MNKDNKKHSLVAVRAAWRRGVESAPAASEYVITRAMVIAQHEQNTESIFSFAVLDVFWGAAASVVLTVLLYVPTMQYLTPPGVSTDVYTSSSTQSDTVSYILNDHVNEVFVE